jgi:hypothetical protein
MTDTNDQTGRELAVACARAMGMLVEGDEAGLFVIAGLAGLAWLIGAALTWAGVVA